MSADWHITQEDGSEVQREPWSCVPGKQVASLD